MPSNAPIVRESERPSPARRLSWLLLSGVLVLVTVVSFAGAKSYRDLAAARERAHELATQIDRAQWRVRDLRDELERLLEDPELLERIAREELGLVGPGEVILVLPEN